MVDDRDGNRTEAPDGVLEKRTMARLLAFAAWRTRSPQDAEDLVQSALERVTGPAGPKWDPNGTTSFVVHVGNVIAGLAANERRSARRRYEVIDKKLAHDEKIVDAAPLADQALGERRKMAFYESIQAEVLATLDEDDKEAASVYRAMLDGVELHAEIAARVPCRINEVGNAYDRIKYRTRQVLAREEKRRLEELRLRRTQSESALTGQGASSVASKRTPA